MEDAMRILWYANLKYEEFKTTVKLSCSRKLSCCAINEDYEIMDSQEHFETEKMRIDNFLRTLEDWLQGLESQAIRRPQESEARPNDSVSNV